MVVPVSIVISTYNRATTLARTLLSLRYLRYTNFEILVVNGPSTDDTEKVLRANQDLIKVVSCPVRNLSTSRNLGINASSGEIIALIDDDAIPEPDWLDMIVTGFDDDQVASVGGFIRDNSGVSFQAKYIVSDLWGQSAGFETLEQADCDEAPGSERFFSLTGTNTAFRRSAFDRIGLFDEVFEYFLDETDVNLRLVNAGFRSTVVREAEIHHKYAPSHLRDHKNVPKNMLPVCRSVAYFAMKHARQRYGWEAVRQKITAYEKQEVIWKTDNLLYGDVTREHYVSLISQITSGVREGIRLGGVPQDEPRLENRSTVTAPFPARTLRPASERLRVCMLSQDEGSNTPGGIGRWTQTVAGGLARRGHEVTVIGRSSQDLHTVDFTAQGYWRHLIQPVGNYYPDQFDCAGLPESLASYSRTLRLEFDRVRERRRFDMVSGPIWDVELASMLGGDVPTCLSLHTSAAIALESKPEWQANKEFLNNHVKKVIAAERTAYAKARLVLANSRAIIDDCSRVYGIPADDRFVIVPHGIADVPEHLRSAGLQHQRSELRLLFVGRLETRKGVATLVPAVERLLREYHHVAIDFIGSGVEAPLIAAVQRLQDIFPGRAQHYGYVSEDELEAHYANADIFVSPSRYESFGLIFIEAMRYSLPCVGAAGGAVPEVVSHNETGLLSPVDDVDGLYANLKTLIEDRELGRLMGANGRSRYEARFTEEIMVDGIEAAYARFARGLKW